VSTVNRQGRAASGPRGSGQCHAVGRGPSHSPAHQPHRRKRERS
jgi:hypothetical protein